MIGEGEKKREKKTLQLVRRSHLLQNQYVNMRIEAVEGGDK